MGYPFQNIVIMIQKEVADRLIASPGSKEYSSLTVWVQYLAQVEVITSVSRHVFVPSPKVESAVVLLIPRKRSDVMISDERLFFRVVKAAFAQRRKTILNSLCANLTFLDKGKAKFYLVQSGIDPKRRGETLNLYEFSLLTEAIRSQEIGI
jgi:16S rRNA (adenine1518-N6/adenine1519-N6)-dimethyltransferase